MSIERHHMMPDVLPDYKANHGFSYEYVDGLGWRFDVANKHIYIGSAGPEFFQNEFASHSDILAWLDANRVVGGIANTIKDLQIRAHDYGDGKFVYPVLAFLPIEHEANWRKFYEHLDNHLSANFIAVNLTTNHHYVQRRAKELGYRTRKGKYNKALFAELRDHMLSYKQPEGWLTKAQIEKQTGFGHYQVPALLEAQGYVPEQRIKGTAVRDYYPPEAVDTLTYAVNHMPPPAGDWYTRRRISQHVAEVSIHGLGWTRQRLEDYRHLSEDRLDDGGKIELHYPPNVLEELINAALSEDCDIAPDYWMTTGEVATLFGIHTSAANNMMRRFGVEQKMVLNKNGLKSGSIAYNPEEVMEIYNNHRDRNGLSVRELSESAGISTPEMRKLLDWYHIPQIGEGNGAIFRKGQKIFSQNSLDIIHERKIAEEAKTLPPDENMLEAIRNNSGIEFYYIDEIVGYRFDVAGKHIYIKSIAAENLKSQNISLDEISDKYDVAKEQVIEIMDRLRISGRTNEDSILSYPLISLATFEEEKDWQEYYETLDAMVSGGQIANVLHRNKATITRLGKRLGIPSDGGYYNKTQLVLFRDYYRSFKYSEGWVTDNQLAVKIGKDHNWVGKNLNNICFETEERIFDSGNVRKCYPPEAEQALLGIMERQVFSEEDEYNEAAIGRIIAEISPFSSTWVNSRLQNYKIHAVLKSDSRGRQRLYYPDHVVNKLIEIANQEMLEIDGPADWLDIEDVSKLLGISTSAAYTTLRSYGVTSKKRTQKSNDGRSCVMECFDPEQVFEMAYEYDNYRSASEIADILDRPISNVKIALDALGITPKICTGLRKKSGTRMYLSGTENILEFNR